ncbi:MAG TPA: hypothetical protein VFE47_02170 [Tepidisphaeraceae bacterium]|jgi:hypothetical protein|nr:hypothetical protein [Tepidisphaeraceae bacterium]
MPLTISLPSSAEEKLRKRADAAGQDVTKYAELLIIKQLDAPQSLAEAAEPLAAAVDASGISDNEFLSVVQDARDAARKARHQNRS